MAGSENIKVGKPSWPVVSNPSPRKPAGMISLTTPEKLAGDL
jgi:hypothetical protein